jgi:molybdate/tungstate transport system substrate-binding protein
MVKQRSRRAFVAGLAGAGAVGTAALGSGQESVAVLCAGSLARTFEAHVGPAFEAETGIAVHGEYYGSNALLRMVQDRAKYPDVVLSADATLLRDRLYRDFAEWDVEFATNCLGVAYAPDTPLGGGLAAGVPWHEILRDSDVGDVVIGDPDLDPLGYRALQAFELAEREHGLDGFRAAAEAKVSEEPDEARLLTAVATGARAGAVCYRNMAIDHGLPFVAFPPAYNFADPALADAYATAVVTIEDGRSVQGRPIVYNATVPEGADAPAKGRLLVRFLADEPALLTDAGLAVADGLPRAVGDPPEGLAG